MPTYEYECKSCGHTFEAFQPMSDAPLKDCPRCGQEIRRLIHGGTGVIFKGSGFYVTDKGKSAKAGIAAKNPKPAESSSAGEAVSVPAKDTGSQCAASESAVKKNESSAAAGKEKTPQPA